MCDYVAFWLKKRLKVYLDIFQIYLDILICMNEVGGRSSWKSFLNSSDKLRLVEKKESKGYCVIMLVFVQKNT